MPEYNVHFNGKATILIRFENRVQWQKWRKYILKTTWDFDGGSFPYTAQREINFSCVSDINLIASTITELLQLGFDVYSCKWELEQKTAEETTPIITDEA